MRLPLNDLHAKAYFLVARLYGKKGRIRSNLGMKMVYGPYGYAGLSCKTYEELIPELEKRLKRQLQNSNSKSFVKIIFGHNTK